MSGQTESPLLSVSLEPTTYYGTHLAALHRQLLGHWITKTYLTGTNIRFDGAHLTQADRFAFPFGELTALEFAHLFSVFNDSRVHQQAERCTGRDDAPPGQYFTVINTKVIQSQHKNKSGIFIEESGTTELFIEGLHIDHFFLKESRTPPSLGTFAFALCAITAHLAGLDHISLIAAGGKGFSHQHIGYKVWPKLGFDAELLPEETVGTPHLLNCRTVQDVLAQDASWWDEHGSQRQMTFALAAHSASWQKLIPYVSKKASTGDLHD